MRKPAVRQAILPARGSCSAMVSMNGRSDEHLQAVPLGDSPSRELAPTAEEVRRTVMVSLSVCLFYITVSSSMVFTNKALSYTFHFRSMNCLIFMQMIFSFLLLRFLRRLRVIDFPDLEYRRARQVMPVSLFYSLNAAVALVALRELSVPSYTMVKRLAPLFTLSLEAILLRRRPTTAIIIALGVMAAGTVLAAKADTSSSSWAWFLGFASCFFQATYLTFVKRSGLDTGLSSFGILYYHSILALPFISMIVLAVGEIPTVLAYEHWMSPSFLIVLGFSLFMGLVLNYALFLCTEKTSPTSTVVSGQVKAMGQTVVGVFTFGGVDMNTRYLIGTVMNISGGCMYAYNKYKQIKATTASSS